jgi:hypothetical protein
MRFSYLHAAGLPAAGLNRDDQDRGRAGLHACYSVDETWHKDWAVLFAAAADKTERIRFGPNVTHVFLREPTLIVQQLATLDELTNGRMEAVVSTGNFGLMAQYGIDWASKKPLSRLRRPCTSCAPSWPTARSTSRAISSSTRALHGGPSRPGEAAAADGRDEGAALVRRGG